MLQAVAVPSVLVHLQDDDRYPDVAALAVIQDQVTARPGREYCIEIDPRRRGLGDDRWRLRRRFGSPRTSAAHGRKE